MSTETGRQNLGEHRTTMQGELQALALVTERIYGSTDGPGIERISIFTDSQSSLQAIASPRPTWHQVVHIHTLAKAISELCGGIRINFYWIPAHVGVAGNEDADKLANDARELPTSARFGRMATLHPVGYYHTIIAQSLQNRWKMFWRNSAAVGPMGVLFPELPVLPFLWSDSRRRVLTSWNLLLVGHIPVNSHLHRFGGAIPGLCDCEEDEETISHFLFQCPFYGFVRPAEIVALCNSDIIPWPQLLNELRSKFRQMVEELFELRFA